MSTDIGTSCPTTSCGSERSDRPGVGLSQSDVDAVGELLDAMTGFASNDQRACYLLTSDWMRECGAAAAALDAVAAALRRAGYEVSAKLTPAAGSVLLEDAVSPQDLRLRGQALFAAADRLEDRIAAALDANAAVEAA